jgi:hypothetical protein
MVDEAPLRKAVDTAWSVYLATHHGVGSADSRRCLLERHPHGKWDARESDAEQLTCFGLAYFARLPGHEC